METNLIVMGFLMVGFCAILLYQVCVAVHHARMIQGCVQELIQQFGIEMMLSSRRKEITYAKLISVFVFPEDKMLMAPVSIQEHDQRWCFVWCHRQHHLVLHVHAIEYRTAAEKENTSIEFVYTNCQTGETRAGWHLRNDPDQKIMRVWENFLIDQPGTNFAADTLMSQVRE